MNGKQLRLFKSASLEMTAPRRRPPTTALAWLTAVAVLQIAALPQLKAQSPAQQSPPPESEPNDDEAAKQERLVFMTQVFAEFTVFSSEDSNPLVSTEKPVLRYGNPVRNFFSDGVTFFWLDGNRPLAAGSISVRGNGGVYREFTSFFGHPLRCLRNGRPMWTPQSGNLVQRPVADAPQPASSSRTRLLQMRQLARRFTVIMQESRAQPDQPPFQTLRLLQNPLYHWSDGDTGLVKGAVFSFSETTDPEALLLLEIDQQEGEPIWTCSFARMSSRPLTLNMDDKKIFYVKSYWGNPRSQNDSYSTTRVGKYEPGRQTSADTPPSSSSSASSESQN